MKKTIAAFLIAGALLLPSTVSANTQAFKDVTVASQNAIVTKIAAAGIMEGTTTNLFEPSRTVTRAEVADIIQNAYKLYPVRPAKTFSDVPSYHEHADAIESLYRAGLIDGTEHGTFNPNAPVKRTHLAKIFTNLYKLTPQRTTKFKDVSTNDAHNGYIGALVQKGIIAGYPDGTFRPNQAVSRMNMATFIYRGLYGKEPQIENKKITSNLPYAATKLASANYSMRSGETTYMTFQRNGNSNRQLAKIFQEYTKDYTLLALDSSDWFISVIDLRGLVEFKPQERAEYLPYDQFFNYMIEFYDTYGYDAPPPRSTVTPYFNEQLHMHGTTYTGVLKVEQNFHNRQFDDYVYYFKEGYGLIRLDIDGEMFWSLRSFKLR